MTITQLIEILEEYQSQVEVGPQTPVLAVTSDDKTAFGIAGVYINTDDRGRFIGITLKD